MRPDCADNPFFLRAYFAWKLGLPFGFHECSRGNRRSPPRCSSWTSNLADGGGRSGAPAFRSFLGRVMNVIHSGTARTRLDDEACDYYPVSLTRRSLRPGVVFADPYGHTLVIARWVPQARERPGGMLAVDAQPDGVGHVLAEALHEHAPPAVAPAFDAVDLECHAVQGDAVRLRPEVGTDGDQVAVDDEVDG
mgnify:CR=1 FL=1